MGHYTAYIAVFSGKKPTICKMILLRNLSHMFPTGKTTAEL